MALRINGLVDRADDVLIDSGCAWHIGQFFGECAPRDGQAVTMHEPCVEQQLENLRNPARTVQVHRNVASRGLQVAQHRRALANPLKIIHRPFNASRVGDRKVVQDRVG